MHVSLIERPHISAIESPRSSPIHGHRPRRAVAILADRDTLPQFDANLGLSDQQKSEIWGENDHTLRIEKLAKCHRSGQIVISAPVLRHAWLIFLPNPLFAQLSFL